MFLWGLTISAVAALAGGKWGPSTGFVLTMTGWLGVWLWFTYKVRISLWARLLGAFGVVSMSLCIAVIWPVYLGSRSESPVTQVRGQLERMGEAMALYVEDSDDHYPPARQWMDLIVPYARNATPFCNKLAGCESPLGPVFGFGYASEYSSKVPDQVDLAVPLLFELPGALRNASLPAKQIPLEMGDRPLLRLIRFGDGYRILP